MKSQPVNPDNEPDRAAGTWAERNQVILVVLTLLLLLVSLGSIDRFLKDDETGTDTTRAFYYDLGTGQLFVERAGLRAPIPAPSGRLAGGGEAGVVAHVYACGPCAGGAKPFISHLSKYSPEAKEAIELLSGRIRNQMAYERVRELESAVRDGYLVRREQGGDWVAQNSRDGEQVVGTALRRCPPDRPATSCVPDRAMGKP